MRLSSADTTAAPASAGHSAPLARPSPRPARLGGRTHDPRRWRRALAAAPWVPLAWGLLGLVRLALVLRPAGALARFLGAPEPNLQVPLATVRQQRQAARLGRAVRIAARLAPWRADCLPQALCARLLLAMHRIPCGLYLGVRMHANEPLPVDPAVPRSGASGFGAHAWVTCGPVAVTGGNGFARYDVIAWCGSLPPARD